MINSIKALRVSLGSMMRKKVTAEYPKEHLPIQDRYMGFPALLFDAARDEPFCTGCMVCVRYCPTQCMSAEMTDNEKFAEGDSHRKKIINTFEINLGRCILCGICVDVCNFDAIEMSHEHELGDRMRDGNRVDLPTLLKMGTKYQSETGWKQSKPNLPSPKERAVIAEAKAAKEAAEAAANPPLEAEPEATAT
ncbi:MAG: 4Fe-4S dicluster domain-containing protein [Chloroflexi bacterium]|nr:4Fe-4S dicluster domain-containing protein [Chloroflexota bacterium]